MTLPKKSEDVQRIAREVEERMESEHGHHHHHHSHEDTAILELLIDSLNAKVGNLEKSVNDLMGEIGRIYKVLAYMVKLNLAKDELERNKILKEILKIIK